MPESAGTDIFDSLVEEDSVTVLNVKFYELKKDAKEGFFSGVVEIDLLFRDFRWFVNVVMRYDHQPSN